MYNTGYPTSNFIWREDNSGAPAEVLLAAPEEGLHVPFSFIMAERGIPGKIYYGAAAELNRALGAATFDPLGPYFNSATTFTAGGMVGQGVEVMRLVDPAAKKATLGIFAEVTQVQVVQYQKTLSGLRILDGSGNPIPRLLGDGVTKVTEPGIRIRWVKRALTSAERYDRLQVTTTNVGGVTTTTYPIQALEMTSPGVYGNRQGMMLYSETNGTTNPEQAMQTVLYRFVPVERGRKVSTTATRIPDTLGALYNDISFKDLALDPNTNVNYASRYVFNNRYVESQTGDSVLPYNLYSYGQNVKAIGTAILAVSPELDDLDAYGIDIIAGVDTNRLPYDHLEIHADSYNVVNASVINYAEGGTDGDTSWEKLEELVAAFLTGSDFGELPNLQQHSMTHYYDPGFSTAVKPLLYNLLSLRDNIKVDVSTQDIKQPPNTKAQDLAIGQMLMFRAQMYPESVVNGVDCCRVSIYAHAAELINGSPLGGLVPFSYNRLIQRRDLAGGTRIKGSAGGMPQSIVTMFRKPNWVADDKPSQALSWSSCINTVRHASRTQIIYPSLRTVYTNDTSLLSDDEVSDILMYTAKISRRVWATYAGRRGTSEEMWPLIEMDIKNECAGAFSGDNIQVEARVFQTAEDANLGYSNSVNLIFTGNIPNRVLNFNVIMERAAAATTASV